MRERERQLEEAEERGIFEGNECVAAENSRMGRQRFGPKALKFPPFLHWSTPWDLFFCRSKNTARADLRVGASPHQGPHHARAGPLSCEGPGGGVCCLGAMQTHSRRDRGQHLSIAWPQPPRARLLGVASPVCTWGDPSLRPQTPPGPNTHCLLGPFLSPLAGFFSTCIQISFNEKHPFSARRARSSF